ERREAQERLIRLNVETGMDLVDSGLLPVSLPLLVEALRITSEVGREKPDRAHAERMQRVRLALVLRECPRLLRAWFHEGTAYDADFSPEGTGVVSAGAGGSARVWDVARVGAAGTRLRHQGAVYRASFGPDGRRVLTASADGWARVWEAATAREVCRSPR